MPKLVPCIILGLFVAGVHPHGAPSAYADGLDFTRLGGWTEGTSGAMEVIGHTVYLANGAWLEEIDVSEPTVPQVRRRVELSAGIIDIVILKGRVCALTDDGLLHVFRRSGHRGWQVESCRVDRDPGNWYFARMNVVGPYIYVSYGNGLTIFDIPSSGPPRVARTLYHPLGAGSLTSAAVSGNALYLGSDATTRIFDVSDPLQPVPVRDLWECGFEVEADGRLLMINAPTSPRNSLFWDLADPLAPRKLHRWDFREASVSAFAVRDTLLYYCDDVGQSLAVSTLEGIVLSGSVMPAGKVAELEVEGDLLCARQKGLTILSLANPLDPVVVGRHETGVRLNDLQFAGDRAYLAGGVGMLTVMDVTDVDRPVQLGAWTAPDQLPGVVPGLVCVSGGQALVASGGGSDRILDVTDPAAIRPLTGRGSLVRRNSYSFWAVAAGSGWFVSGWESPNRLSVAADGSVTLAPVDLPDYPCEVRPGVYVGSRIRDDRPPGVWLAEDGGDPQRIANLVTGFDMLDLSGGCFAASGSTVYILRRYLYLIEPEGVAAQLAIAAFDLSEPQSPRFIGLSFLPPEAAPGLLGSSYFSRVVADGSLLYVWSPYHPEIAVLDARDPGNVMRCGGLWAGNNIVGVTIAQGRLVVSTSTGGFRTYARPVPPGNHVAAAPPQATGLALRALPNPFNPATRVTFCLPKAGQAEVDVFDLGGRRVRRLHTGVLAEGEHEFAWRGDDDDGRAVAAGSYVVRARSGGETMTAKVLLVK